MNIKIYKMKTYKFEDFLTEKKKIKWDKVKKKLKDKEMDFVYFDGDQTKVDTEKLLKWLKDEI
jgi:hypothetical protein